ncbi:hypothetical protein ACRYKV_21280, partial [Escherichia coli]|uniref:hypothetical protein n=1 Tax=Escherichia coli TaxID=562 RepID=UPI003D91D4FC
MKSLLSLHIEANKNVIRVTLQLPKKRKKPPLNSLFPFAQKCTNLHNFCEQFFALSAHALARPEGDSCVHKNGEF